MSNFLIQEKPLRLVLLDFGSTKIYPRDFIEEYRGLLQVFIQDKPDLTIQKAIQFRLLDGRESEKSQQLFYHMIRLSVQPFLKDQQPFYFADKNYSLESRKSITQFVQSLKYSPPPEKLIFLHRKLGGIFAILKRMDIQIDISPYWDQMLNAPSKDMSF